MNKTLAIVCLILMVVVAAGCDEDVPMSAEMHIVLADARELTSNRFEEARLKVESPLFILGSEADKMMLAQELGNHFAGESLAEYESVEHKTYPTGAEVIFTRGRGNEANMFPGRRTRNGDKITLESVIDEISLNENQSFSVKIQFLSTEHGRLIAASPGTVSPEGDLVDIKITGPVSSPRYSITYESPSRFGGLLTVLLALVIFAPVVFILFVMKTKRDRQNQTPAISDPNTPPRHDF